jgi:hypothetical protein
MVGFKEEGDVGMGGTGVMLRRGDRLFDGADFALALLGGLGEGDLGSR